MSAVRRTTDEEEMAAMTHMQPITQNRVCVSSCVCPYVIFCTIIIQFLSFPNHIMCMFLQKTKQTLLVVHLVAVLDLSLTSHEFCFGRWNLPCCCGIIIII